MFIYKEILREVPTKGPGLNIYIILSRISKEEIKIFPKGSFLLVLISFLEFSSYLKKKYSLKPGFAN
jgi:hypothetical protein